MDDKEREKVIGYLFGKQCSCAILHGTEFRVFQDRGVRDLYRLLQEDRVFLDGSFVADKVVGKAAAALMILGGVKEVFADVISEPAYVFLQEAGIQTRYALKVPHIVNRTQTDWCPLERRCADAATPEACLVQIEDFITTLPPVERFCPEKLN